MFARFEGRAFLLSRKNEVGYAKYEEKALAYVKLLSYLAMRGHSFTQALRDICFGLYFAVLQLRTFKTGSSSFPASNFRALIIKVFFL